MNSQRQQLLELVDHFSDEHWNLYKAIVDTIKSLKVEPYMQVSLENGNEQRLVVTFYDWQTDNEIRSLVIQQGSYIHHVKSVLALIENIPTFIHEGFSTEMSKVGIHILLTPQQQVLSMYEVK